MPYNSYQEYKREKLSERRKTEDAGTVSSVSAVSGKKEYATYAQFKREKLSERSKTGKTGTGESFADIYERKEYDSYAQFKRDTLYKRTDEYKKLASEYETYKKATDISERLQKLNDGIKTATGDRYDLMNKITNADETTVRDDNAKALLTRDIYKNGNAFKSYSEELKRLKEELVGGDDNLKKLLGENYDLFLSDIDSMSETVSSQYNPDESYGDIVKWAGDSINYFASKNYSDNINRKFGINENSTATEILAALEKAKETGNKYTEYKNHEGVKHEAPWRDVTEQDENYMLSLARARMTKDEAEKFLNSPYADDYTFTDDYGFGQNFAGIREDLTLGKAYKNVTDKESDGYNENGGYYFSKAEEYRKDLEAYDRLTRAYSTGGTELTEEALEEADRLSKKYGFDAMKEIASGAQGNNEFPLRSAIEQRYSASDKKLNDISGYKYDSLSYYGKRISDEQKAAERIVEYKRLADKFGLIGSWVYSTSNKILSGAEYFADMLGNAGHNDPTSDDYRTLNVYDNKRSQAASYVNSFATENMKKWVESKTGSKALATAAETIYSGVNSAIDSGLIMLASTSLFGGAAGAVIGQAIIGSSAAAGTLYDKVSNGAYSGDALKSAAADGIIEAITETVSAETFIKKFMAKTVAGDSVKDILKSVFKNFGLRNAALQGLSEGSEELASAVLGRLTDDAISGMRSEYNQNVKKYLSQGFSESEARSRANRDFMNDTFKQFIGGVIGGAFMGSVATVNVGVSSVNEQMRSEAALGRQGIDSYGTASELARSVQKKLNIDDKTYKELFGRDGARLYKAKATVWRKGEYKNSTYRAAARVLKKSASEQLPDVSKSAISKELMSAGASKEDAESLVGDVYETVINNAPQTEAVKKSEAAQSVIKDLSSTSEIPTPAQMNLFNSVIEATQDIMGITENDISAHTETINSEVEAESIPLTENAVVVRMDDEGNPVLKIDGEEYAAESVDFGNRETKNLYYSGKGMSAGAVNIMVSGRQRVKDMPQDMYVMEFKYAYDIGKIRGEKSSKEFLAEERESGTISIPENIAEAARMLGVRDRQAEMTKATKTALSNIRDRGRGQVDYGTESAKEKASADLRYVSDALAKIGYDVLIVDDSYYADGESKHGSYTWESGTITLNAETATMEETILQTLSHEITHSIKEINPEGYDELCEFIEKHMDGFDTMVNNRVREGMSEDEAYDEVIAYGCQDMLEKSDVLTEFAQKHKSVFKDMMKAFKSFLDKLRGAIAELAKNRTGRNLKSAPEADALLGCYTELAEVYRKVVGETFERISEAANSGKNIKSAENKKAPTGEKEQYSRKNDHPNFKSIIDNWNKEGRPDGLRLNVGMTGDVLQGLGAIENDIYINSDKINKILDKHPEMTIDAISRIPEILSDPIIVLKSKNITNSRKRNTRLVLYGHVKGKNGLPILTVLDLRPVENRLVINDVQKISSAYTKTNHPVDFIKSSEFLYADKKRTLSILKTIGFQMPMELNRSGFIGSISYKGQNVNIQGKNFSEIINDKKSDEFQNIKYSRKSGRSSVYHAYEIMDLFGIKKTAGNRDVIAETLETMINAVRYGGSDVWDSDTTMQMARKAAEYILPEVKKKRSERAEEVLKSIRGTKVYINEYQAQEIMNTYGSWGNWSRVLMGYIFPTTDSSKANISLDEIWQQWSELFPDYFSGATVDANQPVRLFEIIDGLKKEDVNREIRDDEILSFAEYLLRTVSEEIYSDGAPVKLIDALAKTANSEEDFKAIAEYRALEDRILPLRQKELGGEKSAGAEIENIEKKLLKLRSTEVFRDLLLRMNARAREDMKNVYSERLLQNREKRLKTEEIRKIVKIKQSLDKAALNPTKSKFIPESIKKSYAQFAKGIDAVSYDIEKYIRETESKIEKLNVRIQKETDNVVKEQLIATRDRLETKRQNYIERRGGRSRNMVELAAVYDRILSDEKCGFIHDENVSKLLHNASEIGKPLYEMSLYELETVTQALNAMVKTIKDATDIKQSMVEGFDGASVEELNRKVVEEIRSRSDNAIAKGNFHPSTFMWKQLAPREVFEILGNHTKNGVFGKVFKMLEAGQTKMLRIQIEATKMFEKYVNDPQYKKLSSCKEEDLVDVGFVDKEGNHVKLTRGFMLSVYMDLLNRDNTDHMLIGGLTVPDFKKYYSGKRKASFDRTSRTAGFSAELAELYDRLRELSAEEENIGIKDGEVNAEKNPRLLEIEEEKKEIAQKINAVREESILQAAKMRSTIEGMLNNFEIKFIRAAQEFFDVYCKGQVNDVTLAVFGFKKATVEGYFPIITDKDYLRGKTNELVMYDSSLENMGCLKDRVHATNPILIHDITDVISIHIDRVSRFCGMMPAIRNYNKIMNFIPASYEDSVSGALKAVFGDRANSYLDKFLADIQGAKATDDGTMSSFSVAMSILRGHTAASTLTLNPRVAMSQTASYPTAAKVVGTGPLLKALAKGGKNGHLFSSADRELIAKYSPLLYYREMGYNTVDMGDLTANANRKTEDLKKKLRFINGWINAMDSATVGRLWYAAEYYVEEKMPDLKRGSEKFYEETAKIFNRIVYETQPNYTTAQRPEWLRSKNEFAKFMGMFMTQRFQNVTILYETGAKALKYMSDFNNKLNGVTLDDVRQANREFRWALFSQLTASVTITVMKLVMDALLSGLKNYRDDDDELTLGSVLTQVGINFFDSFVGNLLFGADVISIGKSIIFGDTYYGISFAGISGIKDCIEDTVKLAGKVVQGKEIKGTELKNYAKDLGLVFGLPINNAMQIWDALVNQAENIYNMVQFGDEELFDTFKKDYDDETSRLYRYTMRGQTDKAEELLKGKEEQDVADLYVATLKKYDDRIYTAVEERLNGRSRSYADTVSAIASDGYDEKHVINAVSSVQTSLLGYAKEAKAAKLKGDNEEFKKYRDKMIDLSFGQRFCERLIEDAEAPSDEVTYKALYTTRDMYYAFEAGNTEDGTAVMNVLFEAKYNEYLDAGEKEKKALTDARSDLRSSLTSLYKAQYKLADEAERNRIEAILSQLMVDGTYIFGSKSGNYRRYDRKIISGWIEDEK